MNLFKAEWKNLLRNKRLLVIMVVIMFIPIIYSGIILKGYWDPFGKTNNLPVAVVNNDVPTDFGDKTLNIGEELVGNLKENDDLDWHFVTTEEAEKGFDNNEYYMVITIPEDFSKRASTVLDENPEQMNLIYKVNSGRNYFSKTLGKQAITNIDQEISESVTKEYTKAIFSQIDEMGEGFAEGADGASKMNDGVDELKEGNDQITENLKKLASSSLTFKDGTDQMQVAVGKFLEGAKDLNSGANRLYSGINQYTEGISFLQEKTKVLTDQSNGVPKLAAGQSELNNALQALAIGSTTLNNGLKQVNSQLPAQNEINQLTKGLSDIQVAVNQLQVVVGQSNLSPQLIEQVNQLNQAVNAVQPKTIEALNGYTAIQQTFEMEKGLIQGSSQITAGLNSAVKGSNELTKATSNLNNQMPQLVGAIEQLAEKSGDLKTGFLALVQGTAQFSNTLPSLEKGVSQLTDGASQISEGSEKLADGSSQLGEGISTLKDGTEELSGKLTDGADAVNALGTTDANYEMLATPVKVKEEKANEVPNYGHALAPNFLSLGLYIGALAFNLIFPLNQLSQRPTSGRAWWFSKFSLGFVQAVMGAVILDVIVIFGMGLHVENLGEFVLISVLASLTYMFFIMLLNIALGDPGRFLAMIFLVFQLSASGGMFPVELQSGFFNAINPFMPMTYVIYGFREAMTSALGSDVFSMSIAVLGGCIILFNLLLWSVFHKRKNQDVAVVAEA